MSPRKIPRNIIHDKETLYSNNLQLKNTINELVEENYHLKARIQKLEREINRKNKLLNNVMAQAGSPNGTKKIQKMQKEVYLLYVLLDSFN